MFENLAKSEQCKQVFRSIQLKVVFDESLALKVTKQVTQFALIIFLCLFVCLFVCLNACCASDHQLLESMKGQGMSWVH